MEAKHANLEPLSLKDAPALIERAFPAQKVSAEAQKERKAGSGQTLTALGSYWKGRKPLIMVRAVVLASLLPVTEDVEADLAVFEKLMAMDDAAFGRREPKLSPMEVAETVALQNPRAFFGFTVTGRDLGEEDIEDVTFPIDLEDYPGLRIRWKRGLDADAKASILAKAMADMPYESKVAMTKRPEDVDPDVLYGPIWPEVNAHLGRFGIEAHSHEELVEQLGMLRYGHRPRVGDTFCGGGSIPFEAARLGCDVHASDLNPIACMLTWGAFNIIGADETRRTEIERTQQEVADAVDAEITELGIEHNEHGDRAKAYLYCLETKCPETGWMVPMAPSWVISKDRKVVAKLVPNNQQKRFDLEVVTGASKAEMQAAANGTARDGKLDYELGGKRYTTPIPTLRGDYEDKDGVRRNRLRQWELHDFMPREDDILQERLYAIQWIKAGTADRSRPETFFASVTDEDMEREATVQRIVRENLVDWQAQGLVPDMPIESGYNTDQPIRERGWRYWHQLFNPRQILQFALWKQNAKAPDNLVWMARALDFNSKLNDWAGQSGYENTNHVFSNQALNTLMNYGVRGWGVTSTTFTLPEHSEIHADRVKSETKSAAELSENCELWVTDPPYADAVHYHEITEFFIAWLRKNPPAPFNEWNWDSRRALAIQGAGEEFRRSMVESYSAMADNMPDNGLQCVMFTHQDTSVWGDMISIFWAAGLQVVGAWYIATEASTALRSGAYVQGTVTLILRKRGEGSGETFKRQLFPKIRNEVDAQVAEMMRLNDQAKAHGKSVFNDADLQMAGYAAALKVLTGYTKIDGKEVTSFALQPRRRGEKNVVDEIVEYAAEIANNALIPEALKVINEDTWEHLSGIERFYTRLLAIEETGQFKLDNYQNFSRAFRVDYQPLMASTAANSARLKGAQDFRGRELLNGDLAGTRLGEVLLAIRELMGDKDPKTVLAEMQSNLGATYIPQRPHMMAVAEFIAKMVAERRPEEAEKAEILANRIRNEGW
ncbi:putative DNA methylase [Thioalkalivibrio sp. ALE21]|uniref:anti-phage-associated DUF1156 domain-containing protein n=1 Tax=Thioalkalivibrio sp. ALE21 TaxID=1158175 RepID=UPI000D913F62|nr:anti-phage-associated DUF1156 domain-containing protein [Thioalkalivibrio sp. ALE21]PYG00796.1 putative DNA methylase [Thioalkalivibrio sp. ALE21]